MTELSFDINCMMTFNDTLIEIDFSFIHRQRMIVHFSKNCENFVKDLPVMEIIALSDPDIILPINNYVSHHKISFRGLFRFLLVLTTAIIILVYWKDIFNKIRGIWLQSRYDSIMVQNLSKNEIDELKTVNSSMNYGTF